MRCLEGKKKKIVFEGVRQALVDFDQLKKNTHSKSSTYSDTVPGVPVWVLQQGKALG